MNPEDRDRLSRVVAVINGKGGVGKTTVSANVAGMLAASGSRVLLVDLDPSGNLGEDLGYSYKEEEDDGGSSLAKGLQFGDVPTILKDVRPNLDVIAGGDFVEQAAGILAQEAGKGDARALTARLALATLLAKVADDYTFIFLDCPPSGHIIQGLAVAAARYILVPVKCDSASLKALVITAERLDSVIDINPNLDLLGVVMFDSSVGSSQIRAEFTEDVIETLGGEPARERVFSSFVTHTEKAALLTRKQGLLAYELEKSALKDPDFLGALQPGAQPNTAVAAKTMATLAGSLQAVAAEVVTRIAAIEADEAAKEANALV